MIETPKWEGWWVFLLGKEIGSILSILFCDMFEDIRKVSGAVAVRLPEQQYLFFYWNPLFLFCSMDLFRNECKINFLWRILKTESFIH